MKNYILLFAVAVTLLSCKKYLDVKPDKALVVPSNLQDCKNILSNFDVMSIQYPAEGEANADNYYLNYANWNGLFSQEDKDTYVWTANGQHLNANWILTYQVVFYSNVVLQTIEKLKPSASEQALWNNIRGSALFFRSFAFYQLAQIYAKPYSQNAKNELGIPLRLSPDINLKTERASLGETYDRIVTDLKEASGLLPLNSVNKSQPNKSAAYAMLARTYLAMEDYVNARNAADESLKLNNTLIDYNNIDLNNSIPFSIFNNEVLFHARTSGATSLLFTYQCRVNKDLYDSYDDSDLRKVAFFSPNGDDTYSFKGDYGGENNAQFVGLAVDEMYLVRAECSARAGDTPSALSDLNTLMSARWLKNKFVAFTASDSQTALKLILKERRKELIFRHQRWTDLRRLNKDTQFAETLKRTLNNQNYELPPNDLRYTILIPQDIINETGIQQNSR